MQDVSTTYRFSQRAGRTTPQPISFLMTTALRRPDLISLAAGFVDGRTLPATETAELFKAILHDTPEGRTPLQYDTTAGSLDLRKALVEHLAALDGMSVDEFGASADDLVVTNGSQQLLYLINDVLLDPGDIVICGWPSYFVYTGALSTFGTQVRCVDMDDDGMIPEKLDALLAELAEAGDLPRVKIVYVVDYHQNPTGITLSAQRRPALLDIVKKYSTEHRILLLEDAAYRELGYAGDAPPSIRRFDEDGDTVALVQTFSKPFAPGVKTGYGLLPRDLLDAVLEQKGNQDFGTGHLDQCMLLAALRTGVYQQHVRELRAAYKAKCDALLAALDKYLGDFEPIETTWTRPTGGMYVWLSLPKRFNTGRDGRLFERAVEEGMLYVPGGYCYGPDPTRDVPTHQMRLSFGLAEIEQIDEGVARLARAVKSA